MSEDGCTKRRHLDRVLLAITIGFAILHRIVFNDGGGTVNDNGICLGEFFYATRRLALRSITALCDRLKIGICWLRHEPYVYHTFLQTYRIRFCNVQRDPPQYISSSIFSTKSLGCLFSARRYGRYSSAKGIMRI